MKETKLYQEEFVQWYNKNYLPPLEQIESLDNDFLIGILEKFFITKNILLIPRVPDYKNVSNFRYDIYLVNFKSTVVGDKTKIKVFEWLFKNWNENGTINN